MEKNCTDNSTFEKAGPFKFVVNSDPSVAYMCFFVTRMVDMNLMMVLIV